MPRVARMPINRVSLMPTAWQDVILLVTLFNHSRTIFTLHVIPRLQLMPQEPQPQRLNRLVCAQPYG
ncbi:hypothetical protein M3J09_003415 [Ascochyta lentis]